MDPAYASALAAEDREHWWFVGRRAVILSELARRLPRGRCRLAELGCGSGGVLEALGRFGEAVGVEPDPALLDVALRRGLDVRNGTLPDDIPLAPTAWDGVCLFDVLEHLDDDRRALAAAGALLKPGGLLFLTVPAHEWLWSGHDELLGHRRRYTARRLRAAVEDQGFAVERLTYFNLLLSPAIVLARLLKRAGRRQTHDVARPPELLNRFLAACFAMEARALRFGVLPFGISLLMVARRGR